MEVRELICIGCPLGCPMTVTIENAAEEGGIRVSGNTCKRGEEYAKKEVFHPTRIVTSSVRVAGGSMPRISVKTQQDIPKDKIFVCMEEIRRTIAVAPVYIGDIIIHNCAGTGIPIVATKNVGKG